MKDRCLLVGTCLSPLAQRVLVHESARARMSTLARRQLAVFLGTASIIGIAAYSVTKKPEKPGHDKFSSEKPQALRGERKRTLEEEKRALQELAEKRERAAAAKP